MSYIRYDCIKVALDAPARSMAVPTPPFDPSVSATATADPAQHPTPAFSPLYQQIKGLILQSLQAGEWKPGEAIPSEMELAARFRVSQGTVRKAIDELAAENLVVRRQGKGTFVSTHAEQHVRYRFLKLVPDSGDREEVGPAQRTVLECRRVRASADVARALQLRTGDSIVQVRRVLSFGGVPTILEDLWLPCPPSWKTSGCRATPSAASRRSRWQATRAPPMPCSKWRSACGWCVPRRRSAPSPRTRSRRSCSRWNAGRRCCPWSGFPTPTTTCRWNCGEASIAPTRTITGMT
jgi:DNA-binding transcriptional regulator YhcF (GntR family)